MVITRAFVIAIICTLPIAAYGREPSSIAEICQMNAHLVPKAIQMHKENATMGSVEKLAEGIANDRIRTFLLESFHIAYAEPGYIAQMVQTGEWQRQCIAYGRSE
jgi:hypothetical protein